MTKDDDVKYCRKKPVVVEAVQFTGSTTSRVAIEKWMKTGLYYEPFVHTRDICSFEIPTKEGNMLVTMNDWVIKEPFSTDDRKFYPCKPEIFEKTYDILEVK